MKKETFIIAMDIIIMLCIINVMSKIILAAGIKIGREMRDKELDAISKKTEKKEILKFPFKPNYANTPEKAQKRYDDIIKENIKASTSDAPESATPEIA